MKPASCRTVILTWIVALVVSAGPVVGAALERVDLSALPDDLLRPEGRTRWDLSGLRGLEGRTLERAEGAGGTGILIDREPAAGGPAASRVEIVDPSGASGALRWLFPERYADVLVPGSREILRLEERRGDSEDRLWIEIETVGIGWVHLSAGPREAVLQRVLVLRGSAAERGYDPDRLVHRWVDPAAGVVAEIWGPVSADGRRRLEVAGVAVRNAPIESSGLVKLYEGEVIGGVLSGIGFGWDRGNVPVSSLTTTPHATIEGLITASSWDFSIVPETHTMTGTTTANNTTTIQGSGTNFEIDPTDGGEVRVGDRISLSSAPTVSAKVLTITDDDTLTVDGPLGDGSTQTILRFRAETASTSVVVSAAETCNSTNCGYNIPGVTMDREDRNFDDPPVIKTNAVSEREDRGSDVTFWLRAGAQNEGVMGGFGGAGGESKFCYVDAGRTPVPLWQFQHQDMNGFFLQVEDTWSSDADPGTPGNQGFNCEQNIFNQRCTDSCGFLCPLYSRFCTGHDGTQSGKVVGSGVLTLPSGHTFNALLVRTIADFCVYLNSGCSIKASDVKTVVYLWQVPRLGSVIRLNSEQDAPDSTSFTSVQETSIKFGLFPPLSIQSTGATDDSVSLSWNPGVVTDRIDEYRVYWDTDSGSASDYGNSAKFPGTTATVSDLAACTDHYFTVTSLYNFTDPSSGEPEEYESLLYPTQVSGDPSFVYPVEVHAATTGAVPPSEVAALTVDKSLSDVEICWSASPDPCLVGYRLSHANTPESLGNFSTLADTGPETCWTGDPSGSYFLVQGRGTGGTGPLGHYGN